MGHSHNLLIMCVVDYQAAEPGRLVIRHRMAKECAYIIPIKALGTLPMNPPPIVIHDVKYRCPLVDYTRRRNKQILTTGKHGHRGHGGHRKRREAREASQARRELALEKNTQLSTPTAAENILSVVNGDRPSLSVEPSPLQSRAWIKRCMWISYTICILLTVFLRCPSTRHP
jgi:hypothetical protein